MLTKILHIACFFLPKKSNMKWLVVYSKNVGFSQDGNGWKLIFFIFDKSARNRPAFTRLKSFFKSVDQQIWASYEKSYLYLILTNSSIFFVNSLQHVDCRAEHPWSKAGY